MHMDWEGQFKSPDGLDLYERRWEAEGEAAANVVLIHGYGEHCSRYAHVGAALNAAGLTVLTYDQRGFGHSPGKRGYVGDFDLLLNDLDAYLEHIKPLLEGKPWFMMGHSMGGMVMGAYVLSRKIDARGLLFSSPFLGFPDDVPKILLSLAGILAKILPWLPVGGVENTGLSRDPAVVERAENDPLGFHGRVAARTGAQFNETIKGILPNVAQITAPILVMHGTDDAIVPPAGSQALYDGASSQDKTLKMFEGGYHELWNDLCQEEMLGDIVAWTKSHF